MRGEYLPAPPHPVQYRNQEMPRSQPELLFREILHLKEPLVDLLAFNHFATEQGGTS